MRRPWRTLWPTVVLAWFTLLSLQPFPFGESRAAPPFDDTLVSEFARGYTAFIDANRTPFSVSDALSSRAVAAGFVPMELAELADAQPLSEGDRVAISLDGMFFAFVIIGREPIPSGINLVAVHIDSPALRLSSIPIHDNPGYLALDATAYGGSKYFHWEGIPLRLEGIVVDEDNRHVPVSLGDDGYVFMLDELMPTDTPRYFETATILAATVDRTLEGVQQPLRYAFNQELLRVSGLDELDLLSSEIYVVPAFRARDVGFDCALVGGYGHDDRACVYPAAVSLFASATPTYTSILYLDSREEIGSMGRSNLRGELLELLLGHLCLLTGHAVDEALVRSILRNTYVLACDVSVGVNPLFAEVHDLKSAALLGAGPTISPFVGGGGKRFGFQADPAYIRQLVSLFLQQGIELQVAATGRVDEGGGGTVSRLLAEDGAVVLDMGLPIVSMHTPFEILAKSDLFALQHCLGMFWAWDRTQ